MPESTAFHFCQLDVYPESVLFFEGIYLSRILTEINLEMEEISNADPAQPPQPEVQAAKKAKQSWIAKLGTDEAVRIVYLIFGLLSILLIMVLLQFSTSAVCCGDWDGYYHIRWSALLWQNFSHGRWLPEFKWSFLPMGVSDIRLCFLLPQRNQQ